MTRNIRSCIHLVSLTALCSGLIFCPTQTAQAEDKPAAATAGNTSASATDQVEALKKEQVLLRQMAEAIKRTRRPIIEMVNECIHPLVPPTGGVAGELDIREGDIIPEVDLSEFAGKYAPPRKKYMKLYMDQLSQMIPILQDEIDSLVIPESEKAYAADSLEDIDGYMGDVELHFKKLKAIAKSGDFNQVGTIQASRGIDASLKGVEAARKKLLHVDADTEKKEQKLEKTESKK